MARSSFSNLIASVDGLGISAWKKKAVEVIVYATFGVLWLYCNNVVLATISFPKASSLSVLFFIPLF